MLKILALMFVPGFAFAGGVVPGAYMGKDASGAACQFTVGDVWFENNHRHPLNERIPVTAISFAARAIAVNSWQVGHPPMVNVENGRVRYNHDLFQAVMPTRTGAVSLTLLKDEAENEQGQHKPIGIIYMDDNYRDSAASFKIECTL